VLITARDIQALDDVAVRGLVSDHLGHSPPARLTAAICRVTDRNPFFVEELLQHLVETGAIDPRTGRWPAAAEDLGVPDGVLQLLARRLAHLSAPAGELLQVAVDTFQAYNCTWDEAEARHLWANALPAHASRQRDAAASIYRRIGAGPRWAAWADEPAC